jgi:hypothetical protein
MCYVLNQSVEAVEQNYINTITWEIFSVHLIYSFNIYPAIIVYWTTTPCNVLQNIPIIYQETCAKHNGTLSQHFVGTWNSIHKRENRHEARNLIKHYFIISTYLLLKLLNIATLQKSGLYLFMPNFTYYLSICPGVKKTTKNLSPNTWCPSLDSNFWLLSSSQFPDWLQNPSRLQSNGCQVYTAYFHLGVTLRMHRAIPPLSHAFKAWCLIKHRDNLLFTLWKFTIYFSLRWVSCRNENRNKYFFYNEVHTSSPPIQLTCYLGVHISVIWNSC